MMISSKSLTGNLLNKMSLQLTIYVHSILIIFNAKITYQYINQINYILYTDIKYYSDQMHHVYIYINN